MPAPRRRIVTLYWDNIDRRLVDTQARVFQHLGYVIEQIFQPGLRHGDFLDGVMAGLGEDDVMLCTDIDCIATNRDIIEHAFAVAEAGGLIGCSQVSTHIDPSRIFVAPMFLALSRRTWDRLGRPSFRPDARGDVGQNLHDAAVAAGTTVEYLDPWACVIPKWSLAGRILYGVGTFYRGGVFHLYESRNSPYAFVFYDVAADVLAGRQTDVLALCRQAMRRYPFERLLTKWTRFRKQRRPRRWWRKIKRVISGTQSPATRI